MPYCSAVWLCCAAYPNTIGNTTRPGSKNARINHRRLMMIVARYREHQAAGQPTPFLSLRNLCRGSLHDLARRAAGFGFFQSFRRSHTLANFGQRRHDLRNLLNGAERRAVAASQHQRRDDRRAPQFGSKQFADARPTQRTGRAFRLPCWRLGKKRPNNH